MAAVEGPVTPERIEGKLRELRGEVDSATRSAMPFVIAAGAVAVVAIVAGAFLLGRRKGRRKSTVVEIRRV